MLIDLVRRSDIKCETCDENPVDYRIYVGGEVEYICEPCLEELMKEARKSR